MKSTRRLLALLLSVLMLVSVFAGCSKKADTAEAPSQAPAEQAEAFDPPADQPTLEEIEAQQTEPAPAEEPAPEQSAAAPMVVQIGESNMRTGVLSLLNLDESSRVRLAQLRQIADNELVRQGYSQGGFQNIGTGEVVYYDTLNTMLMALNAGQVDSVDLYKSVAAYLCEENDSLIAGDYSWDDDQSAFARSVLKGILTDDFSFLLMEDNGALRDELSGAIDAMKLDRTLDRLVDTYITNRENAEAVTMPHFDDADTIRVGVTGDLPPLDYVSADGTPAGFNVAVLAEISNRIGKNIELVIIDSGARATALASGTVDVVFWALSSEYAKTLSLQDDAVLEAYMSAFTEEEKAVVRQMRELLDFDYATIDIPDGTITTIPYFSDFAVPVVTRDKAQELGIAVPADPAEPTPTPSLETPKPETPAPPKVTKSPTSETVNEGGSCYFVAKQENAIWATWHFVSPDGALDYSYDTIGSEFPSLQVIDGAYSTMQLKNIPAGMNGWRVYCRFSNNEGYNNTGSASIYVNSRSSLSGDIIVYPKSGNPRAIYQTQSGWYDYDGVYYSKSDTVFTNSVTGVRYSSDVNYWNNPSSRAVGEDFSVVSQSGYWVTIFETTDGWYEHDGTYYTSEGDGLFRSSATGILYASSQSYWTSPQYYENYAGDEISVVSRSGYRETIFKTDRGWYDHTGVYYYVEGDGLYRSSYTDTLYSSNPSYWDTNDRTRIGSDLEVVSPTGYWETIYETNSGWYDYSGVYYTYEGDGVYRSSFSGTPYATEPSHWDGYGYDSEGTYRTDDDGDRYGSGNGEGDMVYLYDGMGGVVIVWFARGDFYDDLGNLYVDNYDGTWTDVTNGITYFE